MLAVFSWGLTGKFTKRPVKLGQGLEANFVGNLGDGFCGLLELVFCQLDAMPIGELSEGHAGGLLE